MTLPVIYCDILRTRSLCSDPIYDIIESNHKKMCGNSWECLGGNSWQLFGMFGHVWAGILGNYWYGQGIIGNYLELLGMSVRELL